MQESEGRRHSRQECGWSSLQAIMRIGGTGERTKAAEEARDGFVGGAMPVGVVVAMVSIS